MSFHGEIDENKLVCSTAIIIVHVSYLISGSERGRFPISPSNNNQISWFATFHHNVSTFHPQTFRCLKCLETFPELHQLQQHIRRHEETECNGQSQQEKNVADSMKPVTSRASCDKPHRCDYCGKNYRTLRYLREHIRFHTMAKSFQCEHCGKNFIRKCRLLRHMNVKTQPKCHICIHCSMIIQYTVFIALVSSSRCGSHVFQELCASLVHVSFNEISLEYIQLHIQIFNF